MRRRIAALAVAGLVLAPTVALSAATPATPAAPAGPVTPTPAPPPYESELLRLSEILGAVHYLRQLCRGEEGDIWREQMEKLIESEDPDGDQRARMVDRFNRGYESYKSVYLSCTPAASEAATRYLAEGARIAGEITARYGR